MPSMRITVVAASALDDLHVDWVEKPHGHKITDLMRGLNTLAVCI